MILKRVIHGIDKNPMAVELAKVSLWLHTFTVGAPLSFLDHHLRCGDSLLGLWVGDANRWLDERGSLIINHHIVRAQQAAVSMLHIEEITDADIAEVRDSTQPSSMFGTATEPLAAFLSLLQGERLLGILDAAPRTRPHPRIPGMPLSTRLSSGRPAFWPIYPASATGLNPVPPIGGATPEAGQAASQGHIDGMKSRML